MNTSANTASFSLSFFFAVSRVRAWDQIYTCGSSSLSSFLFVLSSLKKGAGLDAPLGFLQLISIFVVLFYFFLFQNNRVRVSN